MEIIRKNMKVNLDNGEKDMIIVDSFSEDVESLLHRMVDVIDFYNTDIKTVIVYEYTNIKSKSKPYNMTIYEDTVVLELFSNSVDIVDNIDNIVKMEQYQDPFAPFNLSFTSEFVFELQKQNLQKLNR